MPMLSNSQLKSASSFTSAILASAHDLRLSRSVLRTALVSAICKVDPFARFSFRLRDADGTCVHGVVRIVSEPTPEVDCSDIDNTPF